MFIFFDKNKKTSLPAEHEEISIRKGEVKYF
jgi:hypothetical protein